MQPEDMKLVLVIDPSLPVGVIANTSALLSISIGKYLQENLGPDISDATGLLHRGIFDRAITVLAAAPKDIANPSQRRNCSGSSPRGIDHTCAGGSHLRRVLTHTGYNCN